MYFKPLFIHKLYGFTRWYFISTYVESVLVLVQVLSEWDAFGVDQGGIFFYCLI